MKRLPTLLSCLFLLTACQKDPAMPTAASSPQPLQTSEPQTSEPQITEPRTNEEIRATAEKFLAQYRYLDAASWAYKLQQRGVTLPPHLQAVLDEMHYDPEAPLSTGSIFALSPQQIARLQPKAENGDTAAAIRLSQYYRMASGFTRRQTPGRLLGRQSRRRQPSAIKPQATKAT